MKPATNTPDSLGKTNDILDELAGHDVPTASEIDESIVKLEIRSEEISRGGNADILLEED